MSAERRGAWMATRSGRKFWPLDPRAEDVDIRDVARGLATLCRYRGHTTRWYSVAEHSVIVSLHVRPHIAREALLHDASEAYLGDMVKGFKHSPEMRAFRDAETAVERAVFARFGVCGDFLTHAAIKATETRLLVDEIATFLPVPSMFDERYAHVRPLGVKIPGLVPPIAEELFLARFVELFPEECSS